MPRHKQLSRSVPKPPVRTKGEIVEPIALQRMIDILGPTKTARELGTSTTTLYKAQKNGYVSKAFEVAAAGLLKTGFGRNVPEEHTADAPADKALIIFELPKSKAEMLRQVAKKLGAEEVN